MDAEDGKTNPAEPASETIDPGLLQGMYDVCMKATFEMAAKELKPRFTEMGTPCSRVWKDGWIAEVNAVEAGLKRRICGARTMAGTPCALGSTHPSGRCRFHGGFDMTGAPVANRNAVLHGLYSRRLLLCGQHCAQWRVCPCAGQDLASIPTNERPTCPYEQSEYNAVVTDALAMFEFQPEPNPMARHQAHMLALLQVMTNRAAAALRVVQLTEASEAHTNTYSMNVTKPHAALQAFLRISSEYRAYTKLFEPKASPEPSVEAVLQHDHDQITDTDVDPAGNQKYFVREVPTKRYAEHYIRKALKAAAEGREPFVSDFFLAAGLLNPVVASVNEKKLAASYRPKGKPLPEAAVKEVIKLVSDAATERFRTPKEEPG